jgi:tRNA(fMet)-specific endonuclease VapC
MRYLLDTNTCIAMMRHHPVVLQHLAAIAPGDCVISSIVSYELYTGVEKCAKPAQERAKVDLLHQTLGQLFFDLTAAEEAGRIRALLESQGQPIGPYDILVAGQARAISLTLVTANAREFGRVPGLSTENWQI